MAENVAPEADRWTTRRRATIRRVHKVNALQKTYELVKIGPRKEQIDALRGQIEQAKGAVAFAETNLANTIIRAPVTGTILERAVEKGEFVTTSFVGERGAKGYVVSLADLNDLEVELDISQNDFAKLHAGQHAHRDHRRLSRPQVRRLHQGDLARSQPPESDRADQGQDRQARTSICAPR